MSLFGDVMRYSRMNPTDYDPRGGYEPAYTDYDIAQVSALHRKWVRFQEAYPYNAELLKILFGGSAKDAHMEVEVIPEEKARFIVQILRERPKEGEKRRVDNLVPMGDS